MNLNLIKGIFIGIISPISAYVVYVAFFTDIGDPYKVFLYLTDLNKLPHAISLSLLINLLVFFMKIKTNRDIHAKGILFSTIFYGLIIIFLRFFN